MDACAFSWDDTAADNPIALLTRRCILGEKMLVAQVKLEKGCHVAYHHHVSEQISITISGRVHWKVGEPGTDSYFEQVLTGGEVMVLPSNVPHSVDALEDTFIYDIISPIGPMGVDSQKADSSD